MEEIRKTLDEGGKIIKTVIEEKDKTTTKVIIKSPADNKSTGTRMIQTKECITLQKL